MQVQDGLKSRYENLLPPLLFKSNYPKQEK